jgi:purine-nucleoside phosphorylase
MSTVPEVIAAVHRDLPVFGRSIITDLGGFDNIQPISHEEVLKAADLLSPSCLLSSKLCLENYSKYAFKSFFCCYLWH